MTAETGAEQAAVFRQIAERADPRMVSSRELLQGIAERLEDGSGLKLESVVLMLAKGLTSLERRLIELEDEVRGDHAATS